MDKKYYIGKNEQGKIIAATTYNPRLPGDAIAGIAQMALAGLTIETVTEPPQLALLTTDDEHVQPPDFYMEYAVNTGGIAIMRYCGNTSMRPLLHEGCDDDDFSDWFDSE